MVTSSNIGLSKRGTAEDGHKTVKGSQLKTMDDKIWE